MSHSARDLGGMQRDLPFAPLDSLLAHRARREQIAAGALRPAAGDPPGIRAVCAQVARRVDRSVETIVQWLESARLGGTISFARADCICYGLGIHPAFLWPDLWLCGWSPELATLEEVS